MNECPFCQCQLPNYLWLAMHVLRLHTRDRVGETALLQPWNRTLRCWCGRHLGTERDLYMENIRGQTDGPINISFADHLEKMGGPAACILKATFGVGHANQ